MREGAPRGCMCVRMCMCALPERKCTRPKNDIYVGSYDFRIYNVNRFVAQTKASRTKSTIVE